MNFKKWLTFGPYKKLWSIIGKRPWTFIAQDIWAMAKPVVFLVLLYTGFWTGRFWDEILKWAVDNPTPAIWVFGVVSFLLITVGHIIWGKKRIPNQQGK